MEYISLSGEPNRSVDVFDFSMPTSSKKNIRNFDAYVVKVRYKLVVFFIIEYTQLRFYLLIKIQKNIRHSFPSVDMENFSTTRPPLILDNMFLKNSVDWSFNYLKMKNNKVYKNLSFCGTFFKRTKPSNKVHTSRKKERKKKLAKDYINAILRIALDIFPYNYFWKDAKHYRRQSISFSFYVSSKEFWQIDYEFS